MNLNWKVRFKNPYFWLGLIGIILTAMGVSPEMFTSWSIVAEQIKDLVTNPFMLVSVSVAIIGYCLDPTTKGISDSIKALSYKTPAPNSKTKS